MSSGYKCAHCGKGIQYGHNVSHSKRRTNRIFRPNLHSYRMLTESGMRKKVKLCTSCLRKAKEEVRKRLQKQVIENIQAPVVTVSNL